MMRGESVTVLRRVTSGHDPANAPVVDWASETVDDVLVAPGSQSASTDSTRPDGITVALTLYLPRSWNYRSLRGCRMLVRGRRYTVIGDPVPYDGGHSPTRWNLVVEVRDERG